MELPALGSEFKGREDFLDEVIETLEELQKVSQFIIVSSCWYNFSSPELTFIRILQLRPSVFICMRTISSARRNWPKLWMTFLAHCRG